MTQTNDTGTSLSELDVVMAVTELECSVLFQYGWPEGRNSAVGIVTPCGLDGPGIESHWGGEIFRTHPDLPWDPPSLLYNGYQVFSRGKLEGAWR